MSDESSPRSRTVAAKARLADDGEGTRASSPHRRPCLIRPTSSDGSPDPAALLTTSDRRASRQASACQGACGSSPSRRVRCPIRRSHGINREVVLARKASDIDQMATLAFSRSPCVRVQVLQYFGKERPRKPPLFMRFLAWLFTAKQDAKTATWCCDACEPRWLSRLGVTGEGHSRSGAPAAGAPHR